VTGSWNTSGPHQPCYPPNMASAARKLVSYAEYLEFERNLDVRCEFLNGDVWAMAGGTPRHSKVKANLSGVLYVALRRTPCAAYDSDLKVLVPDTGLATYPDAAVICGPLMRHHQDNNAVTNPSALFEVICASTEAWDRGGKFAHYRRLESLQHYLLVDSQLQRVEHYERQDDGRWLLSEHGPGSGVHLAALGVALAVDDLYEDLPDEPTDPAGLRPSSLEG
jgi:Uma2 family endonuclease